MGEHGSRAAVALPPVEEVPAAHLAGRKLDSGWTIVGRVPRNDGATGGCFSVPYYVEHSDGRKAFLKALNFVQAFGAEGQVVDHLRAFVDAYVYERDLLLQCRHQHMSRVIQLLDYGEVNIPEAGLLHQVPYLITELADGDIRAHQARLDDFDVAWVLRALCHATLGVEQLHSANVAHQDVKPSNVLTQAAGREMKLGDLGCAERLGDPGPRANKCVPGAVSYAPPEQLYGSFTGSWEERRACDVYQLGSLAVQLFLGHCMTALIQFQLPGNFRVGRWGGVFTEVLPYLRKAHADVIGEFEEVVLAQTKRGPMTSRLVSAVSEMTDPDPGRRGHPRRRARRTGPYAVRPYVSLFNMLATEAEVGLVGRA